MPSQVHLSLNALSPGPSSCQRPWPSHPKIQGIAKPLSTFPSYLGALECSNLFLCQVFPQSLGFLLLRCWVKDPAS